MNKQTKLALRKFCEANAAEIRALEPFAQFRAMATNKKCVLRPNAIPLGILAKLTHDDHIEYRLASSLFTRPQHIDQALEWVRKFTK